MERYHKYHDVTISDILDIYYQEYENGIKFYATDSFKDLFNSINKVKYGWLRGIEIHFDGKARLEMKNERYEEKVTVKSLLFDIDSFSYDYSCILTGISQHPFNNEFTIGIGPHLFERLDEIEEATGYCYLTYPVFRHRKNEGLVELIDFGVDNPFNKKKKKEEKGSLAPRLVLNY